MDLCERKKQHNQLVHTEAVWNIPDPYAIVPTCHSGRPVQVPTGVTCVRRHWAVGVALCLRVRAVVNIGREVAHLKDKMYINCLVKQLYYETNKSEPVNSKSISW